MVDGDPAGENVDTCALLQRGKEKAKLFGGQGIVVGTALCGIAGVGIKLAAEPGGDLWAQLRVACGRGGEF